MTGFCLKLGNVCLKTLKILRFRHIVDFGTYRLWMAARAALYLRPGGVGKSELIGWLFRKVEVAAGRSNVCKAKMEI